MAKKGFGNGHKGYSSTEYCYISDLPQCDFSKNETYSFTAENNQYQLYVFTGEQSGLLNYKEKIYGACVVLSGKIPEIVMELITEIATVVPISNLSRELRFKEPQYASQHKRSTDESEITLHHLFFDFTH